MREVKKYRKLKGTKKQIARFNALRKLEYEIAKYYFDERYKKK